MHKLIFYLIFFTLCLQSLAAQDFLCKAAQHSNQLIHSRQSVTNKLTAASDNFRVHFYRCTWQINPAVKFIQGKVVAYIIANTTANSIAFDLHNNLIVDSVIVKGSKVAFAQANNTCTIQLPKTLSAQDKDSVSTFYHGVPDSSGFGSFIQTTHAGVPIIWTLSEPYGARDWWPCRNGLDDKADSIDIFIIHPSQYKATSNGLLQFESTNAGITTTFFKHRYPIVSYLVAIAITNYSVFTNYVQLGNTNLPVVSYIYPEFVDYFQTNTSPVLFAMQLFHNKFTDYPFIKEKYGHTQFGWGGGMEHQTNSFLVNADRELMAHELAHQWFGNKITCGSWQDIWLNEGFATFCTNYFLENYDTTAYKQNVVNLLNSITAAPNGSVWVDDTSSVSRIFSGRLSYNKGAFVLRMLRFTLGDSLFFKGIQNYVSDANLQYKFALTKDFKQHMEQVSGQKLDTFFKQWVYLQGYPSFKVSWSINQNNWAKINIAQTTSHPSISYFKTPLALTFVKGTTQKTIVVPCNSNTDTVWAAIGFVPDTILVDKDLQVISKNNTTQRLPYATSQLNEVKIYPNPATTQLTISIKNPTNNSTSIQLYNIAGQLVWQQEKATPGYDEKIVLPMQSFAKGTYVVRVLLNKALIFSQKIIH